MAFADWVKRSDLAATALSRYRGMREVLQAAYKAGERQGRKDAEDLAQRAVYLSVALEREACAKLIEASQPPETTPWDCAEIIRKRSNAELTGG